MNTPRDEVARTCRCGAFRVLTATGVRYEENAGAIIRHRADACEAFTRDALRPALAPRPSPDYVRGQERMRERATVATGTTGDNWLHLVDGGPILRDSIVTRIRSLPLEDAGEGARFCECCDGGCGPGEGCRKTKPAPAPGEEAPQAGGRFVEVSNSGWMPLPERCPECDYRRGYHKVGCSSPHVHAWEQDGFEAFHCQCGVEWKPPAPAPSPAPFGKATDTMRCACGAVGPPFQHAPLCNQPPSPAPEAKGTP